MKAQAIGTLDAERKRRETMQRSLILLALALSISLAASAARAATAGHLFRSTTTLSANTEDATGSAKPTGAARDDITGAIGKSRPRHISKPATVPAH